MTPLFKKLNFKDHIEIVVLNLPESFKNELNKMENETIITKSIKHTKKAQFVMVFVTTQHEIDSQIKHIAALLHGDAILWICYPKKTSKKYTCDFNRDTGWKVVGDFDLETVRQVAIDEDWSALRFRKSAYIKTITRRESYALTANTKSRTTQKGK